MAFKLHYDPGIAVPFRAVTPGGGASPARRAVGEL